MSFSTQPLDASATREPIGRYGRAPLVTVASTASLREAARVMFDEGIGAVAVTSADGLAGILTERDIVAALAGGADADDEAVSADMTRAVVTARPGDPVLDVALLMLDDGIRHLPIVDEVGRHHGMVSLRDLIRPLVLQALTPPARHDR